MKQLRNAHDLAINRDRGDKLDKLQLEKAGRVADIYAEVKRLVALVKAEPEGLADIREAIEGTAAKQTEGESKEGEWTTVSVDRKAKRKGKASMLEYKKAPVSPMHTPPASSKKAIGLEGKKEEEKCDEKEQDKDICTARQLRKARRKLQEVKRLESLRELEDLDSLQTNKLLRRKEFELEVADEPLKAAASASQGAEKDCMETKRECNGTTFAGSCENLDRYLVHFSISQLLKFRNCMCKDDDIDHSPFPDHELQEGSNLEQPNKAARPKSAAPKHKPGKSTHHHDIPCQKKQRNQILPRKA